MHVYRTASAFTFTVITGLKLTKATPFIETVKSNIDLSV